MPTGVALRDVRQQLFSAAERVLLRDGANALTSRAVTVEAGVAKGVLHKHFTDFDDFLTALVEDRIGRVEAQSAALLAAAGTGTVAGNLTQALLDLFDTVAVAIVGAFAVNGLKSWFTAAFPDLWLFALGALFILVTLLLPKGIVGTFNAWWAPWREQKLTNAESAAAEDGLIEPKAAE